MPTFFLSQNAYFLQQLDSATYHFWLLYAVTKKKKMKKNTIEKKMFRKMTRTTIATAAAEAAK